MGNCLLSPAIENAPGNRPSTTRKIITAIRKKEQRRIAHELHDNVNQLITVAKLSLESMDLPDAFNGQLRSRALGTLLKAIDEIRNLTAKMVSTQKKLSSITEDICTLVEEINYTQAFQINVTTDTSDFSALSAGKRTALFRIVQEQLTNIIKYSKASLVNIDLRTIDRSVQLKIIDNGIGFNLQKTKKGVGLPGIYERARACSGEAVIESAHGCGCSLYVRIPCFGKTISQF